MNEDQISKMYTRDDLAQREEELRKAEALKVLEEKKLKEQARGQEESIKALQAELEATPGLKMLDVRTREEFDAARIDGAIHMTRDLMQEVMGKWDPEEMFVIIDHRGQQGLDAAAYFLGHGLNKVRCLRGGIDAWSLEVDESVRRYEFS